MKLFRLSSKQAIIEAAFERFNNNPKASLADIATHAGVARATLHRLFAGRNDLLIAMTLQAIEETELAANQASKDSPNYSDALEQIFKAMIPLGNRHGFLAQQLPLNHPKVKRLLQQQQHDMDQLITNAKTEGFFSPHLSNAWITQTYDHMIHAAWMMIRSEQSTTQQATDLAWHTLTHGLKGQFKEH